MSYIGRIAPTPTGYLHLGHARTFWTAQERAQAAGGTLLYRNEDLDPQRCKPEFRQTTLEDLHWLGLRWEEPVMHQSERMAHYRTAFEQLRDSGHLFPCDCSRRDIREATAAPHSEDGDPIYPGTCRGRSSSPIPQPAPDYNWRFRVPEGEVVKFTDGHFGPQQFVAGTDFGDFPVWQKNNLPSYQLAVTLDDATMGITEVVRGADLLVSTARQLLLYRALGLQGPKFFHCELLCDENGERLAKRHDALSLRELRAQGKTPEALREMWA